MQNGKVDSPQGQAKQTKLTLLVTPKNIHFSIPRMAERKGHAFQHTLPRTKRQAVNSHGV